MSETEDKINQAGEFELLFCEMLFADGEAFDISPQIDGMSIYEDLYSPFLSGRLNLRDSHDLPNFFGRAGRDILRLGIKTKGIEDKKSNKIEGYFHIYKLADREMIGDRMQRYSYYFVSVESLIDTDHFISKQFTGTGDEIIKQILQNYYPDQKKDVIAEPSAVQLKFISNFWNPSKCIQYAAEHQKTANGDASFLFYENRDGFCFRTISGITQDKPIQLFQENDFSREVIIDGPRAGAAEPNPDKDYKVVRSVRTPITYDYTDMSGTGGLQTRMTQYDLVKKTHTVVDYRARTDKRLNDFPLFPEELVKNVRPIRLAMPKHYGATGYANSTNSQFIQQRISELKLLNSSKIEIDVFGRTDYTVGKVIYYDSNLKYPISMDDSPDSFEDKMYSGFYIITAIHHQFQRKEHMCTIELSKESSRLK